MKPPQGDDRGCADGGAMALQDALAEDSRDFALETEVARASTIFWDVDTQNDFMIPQGRLYVKGAEMIISNLEVLTRCARKNRIAVLGSVDCHVADDAEFSAEPDFIETFPPHCIQGTSGQEKIPSTAPLNPLWIDPFPHSPATIREWLSEHEGEVFFRKRRFDVFSNPNVDAVLAVLVPERIVVYGVALDTAGACAIEGFLSRKIGTVILVEDATRALQPDKGRRLVADWRERGVEVASTKQLIGS